MVVHAVGSGRPRRVILFHATPGSGLMVSEPSDVADELGVSLLCVNRPGFGGLASAAPGFAVAVQDALAAADVLGSAPRPPDGTVTAPVPPLGAAPILPMLDRARTKE